MNDVGPSMDDSGPSPRTSEQRLSTWEEFRAYAADFEDATGEPWNEIWFRGQSDAGWPLSTSLERRSAKTRAVDNYLSLIGEIQPAIETFTSSQFLMPDRHELEHACRQHDGFEQKLRGCATYLAHLRHGGFPSPLLDWTLSPYVAAYFAFQNARHDGEVAIYAYLEWASRSKVWGADDARIVSFGPIIKTHKRHFRQQSRYTSCVQFENGKWFFAPHDAVFGQKDRFRQDLLWKFTIPANERLKVLRFCDKVNLNEFTLFDTEEGLLEMQAMRVFDLRP